MTVLTKVQEFYKDKTIFITGASGFMGKVLIEKLLYSCSELKSIIILVRPKRGKSAAQRVAEFSSLPMFKRIMSEKPEMLEKIFPVFGDITLPNFGLSEEQLTKVVNETQLYFHGAASLKLEATLKQNVTMNLLGTQHALDIARQVRNLQLFMHFSTAFCIPDERNDLMESVYDWSHDPQEILHCAEWMDEETMSALGTKLLGPHPNTYTYTKRLAEILVQREHGKMPVCIVRPSIVSPAYAEPLPGWVDNLNGPVGIMVAAAKGVLRSLLCNGEFSGECIPVDFACNGIITIAKSFAEMKSKPKETPVFNITCHPESKKPWGYILQQGREMNKKYPFEVGLWYPGGDITTNEFAHKMNVALFHWGPAYLIDGLMFLFGQKRFMKRVQTKISQGLDVIQYFTMREWVFDSTKFQQVFSELTEDDKKIFAMDTRIITPEQELEYLKDTMLGGRQYCLKEPLSTIPRARIHLKIMWVLDRVCKAFILYYFVKLMLSLTGLDTVIQDIIETVNKNETLQAAT